MATLQEIIGTLDQAKRKTQEAQAANNNTATPLDEALVLLRQAMGDRVGSGGTASKEAVAACLTAKEQLLRARQAITNFENSIGRLQAQIRSI